MKWIEERERYVIVKSNCDTCCAMVGSSFHNFTTSRNEMCIKCTIMY